MVNNSVTDTFRDGTVLITGGTGFLGKILTEKLLRSCPLKNIVILVRSKIGLTVEQRMADIYKQAVFDRLRRKKPDFLKYIRIINGDIGEPLLGLTQIDRDWLIEDVNFVFHCAATVKFNEPIEFATKINVTGTENVLELATEMKKLKGFVHVSTAYSHCPRKEIKEQYYPVPITAKGLKNLRFDLDEPISNILENWPNTYSFTKAVTENMILTSKNHLPISIFRPSVVGCTKSEPFPGWFENMVGPPSIITGIIIGVLRAFLVHGDKIFDLIPADYTVNALIAVMWDTVNRCQEVNQINSEPKIYNYVSGVESPLTWRVYIRELHNNFYKAPPLCAIWYPFCIYYTNVWVGKILRFWLHHVPATFVDFFLVINSKKPKMMKMYSKTENLMDMYRTYMINEWEFDNSNIRKLWLSMSLEDHKSFRFNLEEFDWNSYVKSYYYGIRKYIIHEELDNVTRALAKSQKLLWLHIFCIFLITCIVIQLFRILML